MTKPRCRVLIRYSYNWLAPCLSSLLYRHVTGAQILITAVRERFPRFYTGTIWYCESRQWVLDNQLVWSQSHDLLHHTSRALLLSILQSVVDYSHLWFDYDSWHEWVFTDTENRTIACDVMWWPTISADVEPANFSCMLVVCFIYFETQDVGSVMWKPLT